MSRKIKSRVVKATLANRDVLDMFHGVLGTSDSGAALTITHPKYLRIQKHVDRFLQLLTMFRDSKLMALFPGPLGHLGGYVAALREQYAASFNAPDLAPFIRPEPGGAEALLEAAEDYSRIPPDVAARFAAAFAAAKSCNLVNTIVVTCKNLVGHKRALQNADALNDRFLMKGAGLIFCPLPDLPQLNFKMVYIDDRLTVGDKEYVLVILHKLFTISYDVYDAVSSPDVDVSEFTEVIMSSIGSVRRHIPRCDQAFDKIIESVDLLKGNFGGYYKDFVASNNPQIIMENFVLDVSKNTKSSPTVAAQFRKIITHYRGLAAQQASHPKLQSLFQQVDANFQELEKKNRKADAEGDDPGTGAASDDDDGSAPTAAARDAQAGAEAGAEVGAASGAAAEADLAADASARDAARLAARRRRRARARALHAARSPAQQESLADELDRDPAAGPPLPALDPADSAPPASVDP